jgi:gamma-glutamyl:cysteine ligase YbdK (ATP-grasp superfamily)
VTSPGRLRLFKGFGVELEYMIVDSESLAIRPIADRLLEAVAPGGESEVLLGELAWSNELVLHVIELKTNGPAPLLEGLPRLFEEHLRRIESILAKQNARLMPTAMHPFMDPMTETELWPHEDSEVYRTFDRIFGCRGHGWSNLQSNHLNLPFHGDEEFGRLHAAIRLVLPLLPALAASSPVADGRARNWHDYRMEVYRNNANRVPSVMGRVVPEPVFTRRQYLALLARIYRDLEPLDPGGVLRHEWVNARGAIARFDRGAIEIRVLDVQECPHADLAITAATVSVLRALVDQRLSTYEEQRRWPEELLETILLETIEHSGDAVIREAEYLRSLGCVATPPLSARELWAHLIEATLSREASFPDWEEPLRTILEKGTLSQRILRSLGLEKGRADSLVPRARLLRVYRELCDCLSSGRVYRPDD